MMGTLSPSFYLACIAVKAVVVVMVGLNVYFTRNDSIEISGVSWYTGNINFLLLLPQKIYPDKNGEYLKQY